jgi:hypothetical protein
MRILNYIAFDCSRIVPEYSFLDARGLGAFEWKSLDTLPEVLIISVHYTMNSLSLQLRVN